MHQIFCVFFLFLTGPFSALERQISDSGYMHDTRFRLQGLKIAALRVSSPF